MKRRNVVVVGAGLAGLAAAYELSKKPWINVTILEARDRIGGRVQSKQVNNQGIDFGGFIIFPWYHTFHHYLDELNLYHLTETIPNRAVYFDLDRNQQYISSQQLDWSGWSYLRLAFKTLPKFIGNLDPTQPSLHRFGDQTIQAYLRSTLGPKRSELFERYFAATCEGYCYGPIDEYKMSFSAIAAAKSFLDGDLRESFYFPQGTNQLAMALQEKIKSHGGVLHLDTCVTDVNGMTVHAGRKRYEADAILFAQTIDEKLYKKLLGKPVTCPYTEFVTAVLEFKCPPAIPDKEWLAIFYEPIQALPAQIVSAINLNVLYGASMKHVITINIALRKSMKTITPSAILKKITPELRHIFPQAQPKKIHALEHWKKTMPIADESLVEHLRHAQGKDGYYYAGDIFGLPSMETALASGKKAAKHMIRDLRL